jgi:hypothetical protein
MFSSVAPGRAEAVLFWLSCDVKKGDGTGVRVAAGCAFAAVVAGVAFLVAKRALLRVR